MDFFHKGEPQKTHKVFRGSLPLHPTADHVKRRLQIRAAEHGRSMAEETGEILRQTVPELPPLSDLAAAIRKRFAALGSVNVEFPPREPIREPPPFNRTRR